MDSVNSRATAVFFVRRPVRTTADHRLLTFSSIWVVRCGVKGGVGGGGGGKSLDTLTHTRKTRKFTWPVHLFGVRASGVLWSIHTTAV